MKLLFVMLTMRGGGAEGALVNLVNNLSKKGHDITVLSLFNVGVNIEKLDKDITYKSIFCRYIPGNRLLFKLVPPKILFRLMIKERYDVITAYLQGVTTRIVAGAPEGQTCVARIGCTFSKSYDSSGAYQSREEMLKCYKRYKKIVANSKDALNFFSDVTGIKNNLDILYNVYDTKLIQEKSLEKVEYIKNNNTINFITTGTLTKVKGYMRLLECFNKLSENGYTYHLFIIGAGEEEAALSEYADTHIKENVTFLGFQKNPYKYVRQADMYICSSYNEGFSNAVAEAVILGVPVLTTDCSGMREILGDGAGGIIVENTDEGLYSGIKRVLDNPAIIDTYKETIRKCQDFFDTENGIRQTETFFESLIH